MSATLSDADPTELSADGKILREARKRFNRCQEWESLARTRFIDDMKFCYGDAYNHYQWLDSLYDSRDKAGKPALTINKTHQHCLQIINDARQNKAGIEVRPVGDGASKEAADIFEGVIRHIEYISNAQAAYDTATWNQVVGGIGWLRVVTDFANDNSFDQEIFIRRVPNALSVYLDPDIQQYDGSDAKFGFVFRDMPKDEFDAAYPALKNKVGSEILGANDYDSQWNNDDHVRVAEYFRVSLDKEHLIALVDGSVMKESEAEVGDMRAMAAAHFGLDFNPDDPESVAGIDPQLAIRTDAAGEPMRREIEVSRIEWFEIAGDQIAKRRKWAGIYIPLIRVVGEETVINGQMDRRGHTRALIDPQRIYNYYSSAGAESVALQTKTPWLVPIETVEKFEEFYKHANLENFAYLPYSSHDEQGREIPPPQRLSPPIMPEAFIKGVQLAANEMMMVSGQYQAVFGQQGNETSGKAINARQRQGDNATYHFIDHLAQSIRFLGKILLDLIPKIYDTARVLRILDESGEETEIHIDPEAEVAHQTREVSPMMGHSGGPAMEAPGAMGAGAGAAQSSPMQPGVQPSAPAMQQDGSPQPNAKPDVRVIFNPNVGRYDVIADVGPAYATRRQEAFNAFTQIMQGNPELMDKIGDLMFKAADFPMAEDIAERFDEIRQQNIVPKAVVDKLQAALQQLQQHSQQTIGQLVQQIAEMQIDAKRKAAEGATRELRGAAEEARDALTSGGEGQAAEASERARVAEVAEQKDIDWYKAETARLAAVGGIDPEALKPVLREIVSQVLGEHIGPLMDKHAAADQARMPKEPERAAAQ